MLLMALILTGMLSTGGGTKEVGFFFLRFVALLKLNGKIEKNVSWIF